VSFDDRQDQPSQFRRSPTGPRVAPPRQRANPPAVTLAAGSRRYVWSVVIFILLFSSFGIRAYRDLSRPDAWAHWKDQYFSPSMTSSLVTSADFDGGGRGRPVLFIRGKIGAAAASWFRDRLEQAHLAAGDTVLVSSLGGDLNQAVVMGEIIRSHGLSTAVGVFDASGRVSPSYCASACVFVYAGGKPRYGVEGSRLGVHRFVTATPGADPVAETQRTTGMVLGYMTKMGVSSSAFVEAMSQSSEIRWLGAREAAAMNLVTDPVGKPRAAAR
jgi:hypothetical protein